MDDYGLTFQERLELAAVSAGLKVVQRLERPASAAHALAQELKRQGLSFVEARFHVVARRRHPLGDAFMRTVPGPARGAQRGIYYVSLRGREGEARKLAEVEARDPGSSEIGLRLSYPACCVSAYEDIQKGRDWVESMLTRTPVNRAGRVACNRLGRLFGTWALLPDYFPCSFACSPSADWSAEIVRAAAHSGLGNYLAAAEANLRIPVRVEAEAITLLDLPPRSVSYTSGVTNPCVLAWTDPA